MHCALTSGTATRQASPLLENGSWHPAVVVAAGDGDALRVRLAGESGVRLARAAAGALLQPEVGDTVLLAIGGVDCWAVLVLQRAAGRAASLTVPGASALTLSAPALTLQARHTLTLASDDDLQLRAARATVRVGVVRFSARVLQVVAQRLALWADLVHTQAQSLVVRAERRVTRIDGADLLRAGQVLTTGEQLVQLQGRQIQAQAEENVSIDGKRIFMG